VSVIIRETTMLLDEVIRRLGIDHALVRLDDNVGMRGSLAGSLNNNFNEVPESTC
jgi:hypothetical protein